MTRADALREARGRWGRLAHVWRDGIVEDCRVGEIALQATGIMRAAAHGIGPTWEAAFSDADRRDRDRQAEAAISARDMRKQEIGEARLRGDR